MKDTHDRIQAIVTAIENLTDSDRLFLEECNMQTLPDLEETRENLDGALEFMYEENLV